MFIDFLLLLPLMIQSSGVGGSGVGFSTASNFVSNSIKITEQTGSPQTSRPIEISRVFRKGEIPQYAQARVNGTPVTTQCDVRNRWGDGSLKHAELTFVTSLTANQSITVDFVNQSTGNNSGYLTQGQIEALTWDVTTAITNGSTFSADALTMLTNGSFSYWKQGSICTKVIIEDATSALAYDIGFDSFNVLHPIFLVTFFPGTSYIKYEAALQNAWDTKREDQTYSLTVTPQAGSTITVASFLHNAMTMWRETLWQSNLVPGAIAIDMNLPYLESTFMIPNFDKSLSIKLTCGAPSNECVGSDITNFAASDQCAIEATNVRSDANGLWLQNMGATGGRPDIGLFPAWYMRYLYAMGQASATVSVNDYNVMIGQANCTFSVNWWQRESASGTHFYDVANTVNAFGLPFSINFHSSNLWGFQAAVGSVASNAWSKDPAHVPNFSYIPYLLTGDWFYLQALYQQAHWDIGLVDPSTGTNYGRHGNWGWQTFSIQTRGEAWTLRDIAETAALAPDSNCLCGADPEGGYLTTILTNNFAFREGFLDVTTGSYFNNTPGSMWYVAHNQYGGGGSNVLNNPDTADQYAAYPNPDPGYIDTNTANPDYAGFVNSPWQYNYLNIALSHIVELGYTTGTATRNVGLTFLIHQLNDPAVNPWLAGDYRVPSILCTTCTGGSPQPSFSSPYNYYTSWAQLNGAYTSTAQAATSYQTPGCTDIDSGYPVILRAAASFATQINDSPATGAGAWAWANASCASWSAFNTNPQFDIIPR